MTRLQYWLINGASVLVALLIALEIRAVHEMDDATVLAQKAQAPLIAAQQEAPKIQRLIQRTALGATRDAALKDLLAKYGVSVKPLQNDSATNAPAAPPSPVSTASTLSP